MDTKMLMIQPVVALVIWSLVMWAWMYVTRLPAIAAAKMPMDPNAPAGDQMSKLPAKVRWKADNYNHLMEQPTIFYAIALSLAVIGDSATINILAAWTYVALRILHSLIQALGNKIELRFFVFLLSNIPLILLTFNGARTVFSIG
ncbi:MAPEG family protein [Microbulbifer sp. 2304DJ12-6]|uniref:MAPEG family protein n=1 Tax=Microbulbifer sp. 2304DJ12-6 TaxID=3233340 RepID=UPI0039AF9554